MMLAFFVSLFTTLILVLTVVILFFKNAYSYWEKKDVPTWNPRMPGGNLNMTILGKISLGQSITECYKYFKSKGVKHAGLYFLSYPVYMPLELDTIKNILIKDFQYFMDHGMYYDEINEPISAHLFSLEGTKWKNLRAKLSPTFTSGKIKMMFPTIVDVSKLLLNVCDNHININTPMNVKDVLARFNTDVIASCAFGIETNALKNPKASEFRKMGRRFFEQSRWESVKFNMGNFTELLVLNEYIIKVIIHEGVAFPNLIKILKIKVLNEEVHDFFLTSLTETILHREKHDVKRNDFLQLLIQLKKKGQMEDESGELINTGMITLNEACAQAFVFFLGGSDTSSTALTFCLLELMLNIEVQEKLRKEIMNTLKKDNEILSYEGIKDMKYMDMVINETLRKHPPAMMLMRVCLKDYQIPGTDIVIEKGGKVTIPVKGLQTDPEYYPDPDKFDPERFSEENKANRHISLWLPFGEGPRICIGMRFGVMQMKIALSVLLSNYKFTLNSKTKMPVELNPHAIVQIPLSDIMCDIEKL